MIRQTNDFDGGVGEPSTVALTGDRHHRPVVCPPPGFAPAPFPVTSINEELIKYDGDFLARLHVPESNNAKRADACKKQDAAFGLWNGLCREAYGLQCEPVGYAIAFHVEIERVLAGDKAGGDFRRRTKAIRVAARPNTRDGSAAIQAVFRHPGAAAAKP